jgi:type I restriction enzyme R subunit
MPEHVKESQFEKDVADWLVSNGGYSEGDRHAFDPQIGLDPSQLFPFVEGTQAKEWSLLVSRYGGDEAMAKAKLLARIVAVLGKRGTIHALRNGVDDQGVRFKLAHFKPASGLNPALKDLYGRNRLTVTRQLRYSADHGNSLDLTLFANGLPVATAELKSPLNGQTVDDAIKQYMEDRDPLDLVLRDRAIVHFAVDPSLVYMTTRLAGSKTAFLPFNRGSAPGKLSCGMGNPPNPDVYATAYLWEGIWSYDAWLEILGRFVEAFDDSAAKGAHGARRIIFPRYHQWDAVTRLAQDALVKGPGETYLIQHSAGSGKSNSIGWLAHRLSLLHDAHDEKVFGKVIVVTDRRVLDEQLRATVQQFENVPGTIVSVEGKTGSKSAELAEALTGKAQIVTVTLETFPFVIAKIADAELAVNTYAIVVDEAHSSQTGDASTALKQALGIKAADAGAEVEEEVDAEAALAAIVAARGRQPNLSFFAFTATPKDRTVELFGTVDELEGTKRPFHLYTMRQAIEEEFILDVLRNYVTHRTYYRLAAAGEAENEEVDVRKAATAIKRFVARNPSMIAQKAALIVEHFRAHTAKALGGQAKAMVVTDSRAAAVRYKRAIDRHIADHHYRDIRALVAFSGSLLDDLGDEVTESMLNGFPESQTAKRFKGEDPFKRGDYQVLIVAEKFQTGFDEPYLHSMFVDKPLKGVNAVQTLSRLNRKAPGKDETFVLDFRNDADDIGRAFQRYYEAVIIEPTDANILYDLRVRIMTPGILDSNEIHAAAEAYFGLDPEKRSLKLIHANLDPAVLRFAGLDAGTQMEFKDAADQFVRVYAFLSQVIPFTDAELEQLYVYVKALRSLLRDPASGGLDLGEDLVLTHLRLEDSGSADISLEPGQIEPAKVFVGEGGGSGQREILFDSLGAVIEAINQAFGAGLDERDRLEVEKIKRTLLADDELRAFARANPEEHYALEFGPRFKGAVLDQEERNRRLYDLLMSKPQVAKMIEDTLMRETYFALRAPEKPGENSAP